VILFQLPVRRGGLCALQLLRQVFIKRYVTYEELVLYLMGRITLIKEVQYQEQLAEALGDTYSGAAG